MSIQEGQIKMLIMLLRLTLVEKDARPVL
jgi:hypothetical protein